MAATKNGQAKAKTVALPPEVRYAKLEITSNGAGEVTTVGLPITIAKNILTNTKAKKSLRKSVRGGATDTVVVKLNA